MRARFCALVQNGPGAHPTSYTVGSGSFPKVSRPGRGVNHPTLSSAEAEERAILLVYVPSWQVVCRTIPFTLIVLSVKVMLCGKSIPLAFLSL
jgi:hypothetical protein